MFWMMIVYPRAASVALITLFVFGLTLFIGRENLAVAFGIAIAVAVGGTWLTMRVAAWEARQRGGTGREGSGPIEPWGPAGPHG